MHPVGDTTFARDHEKLAEKDKNACRACHGVNGEGSVLSRTAADRILKSDDQGMINLAKGTPVTCSTCHENKL
jgi:cytochrome c553